MSEAALRLLRVAAAFTGGIDFEVARRVAELDEKPALDALDEALAAQLLVGTANPRTYDFTHALVRHALYEALSPARQVRLHRQIAETTEAVYGVRAIEHAAMIARHYHCSAALPGAEGGVSWCLAAAEQAERATAFADLAAHLQAALDLLPADDPVGPGLMGRLGLALAWSLRFADAAIVAGDAAALIAETESRAAAAAYVVNVLDAFHAFGGRSEAAAGRLARQGLEYTCDDRSVTWATLKGWEIYDRERSDLGVLGIALDTPERRAVTEAFGTCEHLFSRDGIWWHFLPWKARSEYLKRASRLPPHVWLGAGAYRRDLPRMRQDAEEQTRQGRIGAAVNLWTIVARSHAVLGEFALAEEARLRGAALAKHLTEPGNAAFELATAEDEYRMAMDEGWDRPMANSAPREAPERYGAVVYAAIARTHARMGRVARALHRLESVLPIIARAPGWVGGYAEIAYDAAETLWLTQRTDHVDLIERNLREKVIPTEFRYPMREARLAMGRVCALQGRYDEARDWFAKARAVLDEQGARPLRAIVDYDEALMYARRGGSGDAARALPLLEAALEQFRTLGMPGWIRRTEALLKSCAAGGSRAEGHSQ
jgi:hypothetical protein